jgi:ferric-dicitrate binding protein FerR (iron transport regulator)
MEEDKLLKKWLNNDLTDAEKEAFSKRSDYAQNQNIIDKAQHFKASHFSKPEDFETFKTNYKTKSKVKRLDWIKPFLRIASVLVIGLIVYFNFFNTNIIETQTLASQKTLIQLPDSSEVQLNANSQISYDANSWDSQRRLNLNGEAYFKVAKGATFDVITPQGIVTVVGTEFNVKSRADYFEVMCYEGIVRVASDTITRQLVAGDTYRILNHAFSEDHTDKLEPSWTKNQSQFKAIPLSEVMAELERQYAVSVSHKNADTARLFTGGFSHNNLEHALDAITQPMNLTYTISSSNQVLIHDKKD